jgi:RNA polymerase sigma factor (sigma-70 family)
MEPPSEPGPPPGPEPSARREPLAREQFDSVRGQLLALVRRISPRWLAGEAEDLVQSALLKVLDRLDRGGENQAVTSSYLMRAAYCVAVDEMRRRFRRPEVARAEGDPEPPSADLARPDRQAGAREVDRGIRACLAALSGPRRAAVTLYLLGYSLKETGEACGWSGKRAEHLVYRGLGALRRCLAAKGLRP